MADAITEQQRQRILDGYRVVDSLPEDAYDDIVRLASEICRTPIALVSLIDRDRQWLKARLGLDANETTRDIAFCDHAIRSPSQLMEIPDAKQDPRFSENPLVTGEPQVCFYAGMPLLSPDGAALGTVCVLDREPRQLTGGQKQALAALARLTMTLLNSRQREHGHAIEGVLAAAKPVPVAPAVGRTLVLLEMQDFAGAVKRKGERSVERDLQQLEERIDRILDAAAGDRVSRVTGSVELIVVLNADDSAPALASLGGVIAEFERETSLRVLFGYDEAQSPGERLADVFLRADAALSAQKNGLRAAA